MSTVIQSNNGKVFGWRGSKDYFLQTENEGIAKRISRWGFSQLIAYGVNTFLQIFRIPATKWRWVCLNLELPLRAKSKGRVKQGQKLGRRVLKRDTRPIVIFTQSL